MKEEGIRKEYPLPLQKEEVIELKDSNQIYKWLYRCAFFYFIAMFLILPLYYQNNYINIIQAKTQLFAMLTTIYLIIGVVLWIWSKEKRQFYIQDGFFFLFLFAVTISTIRSENFYMVWRNPQGKHFGAMVVFLCLGIYFLESKGFCWNKYMKISLLAGTGIVFVLTILNRYNIDPLDMYQNLIEYQRKEFLSTIGNINVIASYLCIFLPLLMGLFLFAKEHKMRILYGIWIFVGVMAGICTNSDSFLLGTVLCMIFLLWFSMEEKENVIRYLILCMLITGPMIALKVMNGCMPDGYHWKETQILLINEVPWYFVLLFLLGFAIYLHKTKRKLSLALWKKVIFSALAICVVLVVGYLFAVNVFGVETPYRQLIFNDEWGSYRGFVWSRSMELYLELPMLQKLIGVGLGGFKQFFDVYNPEAVNLFGQYFVDAHNEGLHFLVTTGILGVTGYFGMIVTALIRCLRKKTTAHIILAAIFFTWIVQGIVNNPLVCTTPYVFIFLGIERNLSFHQKQA